MKTPRLFVQSPSTDGWRFCGGPDLEDAMKALSNVLRSDVEELLAGREFSYGNGWDLKVTLMSDEEVAALPEL